MGKTSDGAYKENDKVLYRLVLGRMHFSKACFSSFMSMHCSSILSLGSIGVLALHFFLSLACCGAARDAQHPLVG